MTNAATLNTSNKTRKNCGKLEREREGWGKREGERETER